MDRISFRPGGPFPTEPMDVRHLPASPRSPQGFGVGSAGWPWAEVGSSSVTWPHTDRLRGGAMVASLGGRRLTHLGPEGLRAHRGWGQVEDSGSAVPHLV